RPAAGLTHAGPLDGDLLTGEGGHAPLAAIPGVGAVRLPPVAWPAEAGGLVLPEAGGDQQAEFHGPGLQGIPPPLQQLRAVQGQLDLMIAGAGMPSRSGLRRALLVRTASALVISLQGGSSFQGVLTRVQSNDRTGGTTPHHFSTTSRTPSSALVVIIDVHKIE